MPLLQPWEEEIILDVKNLVEAIKSELLKIEIRTSICDSLKRELRGFDSEMFIVAVMGMLKSGKSTFVNLLARSKLASPTGYGVDTTLRPALIMQASEGKNPEIDVWFAKNPSTINYDSEESASSEGEHSEMSRESLFSEVFAHIRGAGDPPKATEKKTYYLNEGNLKTFLCQEAGLGANNKLPQEPIIVVVKTPRHENSLLSEKVVILDTPGLDSYSSEWTKNSWYEWLMAKCDLMLFLQSSVAPLNAAAKEVLKRIQSTNRKIPIWLVQNQMDAKHWLKPEKRKEMNELQLKKSISAFEEVTKGFSKYSSNLGMADSVIFEEEIVGAKNALLAQSEFEEVQKGISNNLEQNAADQRKKNCKNAVKLELDNLERWLQERIEKKKSEEERFSEEKREIYKELSTLENRVSGDGTIDPPEKISDDSLRLDLMSECKFDELKFKRNLNQHFKEGGKYSRKELDEFSGRILQVYQNEVEKLREEVDLNKLRWGNENCGSLRSKIRALFSEYLKSIWDKEPRKYFSKTPDFETESKAKLKEGCRSELWEKFPEFKSKGRCLKYLWELKYSSSEAKKTINETTYNEKTLCDTLKEAWEKEVGRLGMDIAKWVNEEEINRLRSSAIKELKNLYNEKIKGRDSEVEKIKKERERIEKIFALLLEAKGRFGELDRH